MRIDSPIALLYHTYNSLFLSLPFKGIEMTGTHLALFSQECEAGLQAGKSPEEIVHLFWAEYFEKADETLRHNLLFSFIQYIERQVVLFDSVEDALFEQSHEMQGPGSMRHLLNNLNHPAAKKDLVEALKIFHIRLVLTAHPTQFYPGKVLGIINDLGKSIKANDLEEIRLMLMQLGKTAFVNRQKPTPVDEAAGLGWYMEHIFFHAIPEIVYNLLIDLDQDIASFENPYLLQLGFWPGGDRDGNPYVTSETTLAVARQLRRAILRGYYREIKGVRRRLTFQGVEDKIIQIESRIYYTLYGGGQPYTSCKELIADLLEARQILVSNHDGLFLAQLDRMLLKVRLFGFHFASLDIRQDSRKHQEVWQVIWQHWREKDSGLPDLAGDEWSQIDLLLSAKHRLDENDFADSFVKETIRTFSAIAEIQQKNGELGCHRYIISNCQRAGDVMAVLALAQQTIGAGSARGVDLDIVPLFETIDDLAGCDKVMAQLYSHTAYATHLQARNQVQHIMLGFSDGTKDGGYLRANWSIYRAKQALTRISREYGVSVVFFDGRGGPPGRGGGNNASYYAAQGPDIENKAIQVTIQGQTVSSTYGTIPAAVFNIERLLTAGLSNLMPDAPRNELSQADSDTLEKLATAAYEAYLSLKNHPDFVPYLEHMTPLKWYGDSNIASRPTKRSGGMAMQFEDLRAIPFVGAWAQMKQNVPGYYGFGAALARLGKAEEKAIRHLYQHSLFFRTLVENSMQSLAKSNFQVTQYIGQETLFRDFWQLLHEEFRQTETALLALSGHDDLLSSRRSIEIREEIVLPLIVIQQYALQQLQREELTAESAEVYRKLVLRAMFGIINAARNAA